jgi:hypothetical protein
MVKDEVKVAKFTLGFVIVPHLWAFPIIKHKVKVIVELEHMQYIMKANEAQVDP